MVTVISNGNYFRDEKGDNAWWMCNVEQAVHLVPVVLLAFLLILYICSSPQFHEYKMLGDKMNQNVVEVTMMTEWHLQQAGSSKSQAEEQQTLSMQSLRKLALSCSIIHQTYQSIPSCSKVFVIETDAGTS